MEVRNCAENLTDGISCTWQTRKLLCLAERCLQKGEHSKGLQLLEGAPDLRPLLHVPEAETISLVRTSLVLDVGVFTDALLKDIWLGHP